MPRPAKFTKAILAQRLETVFKENGYEGASLMMLADATALSKASLYHHFPKGKEEMAAHVLAHSGASLQKFVLAPLMDASGAALMKSLKGTKTYYSGDVPICLMNSLLLGEGRSLFGPQIASAVTAWQDGMVKCLEGEGVTTSEANAWAIDALQRIQGALVLCRVTGTRKALEDCIDALRADVADWLEPA